MGREGGGSLNASLTGVEEGPSAGWARLVVSSVPMPRSRSTARSAAVAILSGVVLVNALWRGGVGLPAQAATAVAGSVALWLASRPRRRTSEPVARTPKAIPWLVAGLGLVVLVVGLQLVPLPPAALLALAPRSAEVQRDALAPLGLFPAWRPISLDPGATALEMARLASWLVVAAAAALLAGSREQREQLLMAMGLAGGAVAAIGYGAAVAGVGSLTESRVVFINPNHLASFMLLTCWIALGFGLRETGPKRVAWLAGFVVIASQVFLSLSRAGIAAFFVAAGVSAVLAIRSGHAARALEHFYAAAPGRTWRLLAAPVAVFTTLAVTAWLALDRVVGELRTLSEIGTDVKLSLWPLAWQMLKQFPLFGVGRGAFATVFPAYKVEQAQVTFTHLENTWLQIPLDVGVPVGLAIIALFAWTWLSAARARELTRPMLGALAGVAGVAAHDLFDFSLELNSIAIPFLMVLAIGAREGPVVRLPRWSVQALAVTALGVAAIGFAVHIPHRADAQAAAVASAATADEARSAAALSLDWHPADWVPPAIVGTRLVDEGRCHEGIEWLNRAMVLNPTAPQPHRAVARCLAASGQAAAARREYRLAFSYGDAAALQEARDAFPEPGALLQIAPDTPAGLMAAGAVLRDRPEEAAAAFQRAWDAFRIPAALAGLARATSAMGDANGALLLAQQLQREVPAEPSGYLVAAEALVKLEQEREAVQVLEDGVSRLPRQADLLLALGSRHYAARRYSQAKLVFERIVAREGWEVARKRSAIASTLEAQGRYSEALQEARTASASLPGAPGPLLAIARIAEQAGLHDVAIDALERAAALPTAIPGAHDEQLKRLRAAKATQGARWLERQERNGKPGPESAP